MPDSVWRLIIEHSTQVTYPEPVASSYNEIRMQPADEPGQSVLSSRLDIDPFDGVFDYLDYFGTGVAAFDIHHPHTCLSIVATSTVETFPRLARGGAAELVGASTDTLATGDVRRIPGRDPADRTRRGAGRAGRRDPGLVRHPVGGRAARCATCLHDRITYAPGRHHRASPRPPRPGRRKPVCARTSRTSRSACCARWAFPPGTSPAICTRRREVEIGTTVEGESHAWVEWFDGEWSAFDPTNDVAPGRAHVVVGRGRDYRDVPPIKGVYAGPDAIGNEVSVKVTRVR